MMTEETVRNQKYRVIFSGRLNSNIEANGIRENLLRLYRGNHAAVDRFFTGRALAVRKNVDHAEALRCLDRFEEAGVFCRIVEEPDPAVRTGGMKPVAADPSSSANPGGRMSPPAGRTHLQGSRAQNALALMMILLLVTSVAVRIYALKKAHGIHPPDLVTSNTGGVCVHANGTLYFLSHEGVLRRRVVLSERGIARRPADIRLLKDDSLLVGLKAPGEILRCAGAEFGCRKIGPAGGYAIADNFRILPDEEKNRLFITDTNGAALLVQDMDGSAISPVEGETDLSFPSGMALDDRGRLWISNAGRGAVVSYADEEGRLIETDDTIRVAPDSAAIRDLQTALKNDRGKKPPSLKDLIEKFSEIRKIRKRMGDEVLQSRPLSVAWDSRGRLWVIANDGFMTNSGLSIFNPDGTLLKRLEREKGSLPLDLSTAGDRVLVADSGLFRVSLVDTGTLAVSAFGDQAFRRDLDAAKHELSKYEAIAGWAGWGIWLMALGTLVLVVVIAVAAGRRGKETVSASRHGAGSGLAGAARPPDAGSAQTDDAARHSLIFTGSGSEYFRIWIVNTFLTIVTLGIYAAWAKVRTRRYFYRNTLLDGHPFDYTADPVSILRGYLIVGSGLLVYSLVKAFQPMYTLAVIAVFAPFIPFLIFKSLRFFMHNSVYRNIRFRFLGSLRESYRTYLLYPLLIPFTLGLILPYWEFRRKKYFFDNAAYGSAGNTFRGESGRFYSVYIRSSLVAMVIASVLGIFAAVLVPAVAKATGTGTTSVAEGFVGAVIAIYAVILLVSSFAQSYIYANITNYCFNLSELGPVRFESTLRSDRLFWIRISNIAAIVLSLGLLVPWARVRRMRYVAENLVIVGALNTYTSAVEAEESSYGDVATGVFDFEVGL